jgi:ABC-type uncharacterized transport system ATPase subunit
MHPCIKLLEQALVIGELELEYLAAGEVDEVEELSEKRFSLLDEAWERQSPDCLDEFREKFLQMQELQHRLSQEAVQLHAILRNELKKSNQESARYQGYRQASELDMQSQTPMLMSRMG